MECSLVHACHLTQARRPSGLQPAIVRRAIGSSTRWPRYPGHATHVGHRGTAVLLDCRSRRLRALVRGAIAAAGSPGPRTYLHQAALARPARRGEATRTLELASLMLAARGTSLWPYPGHATRPRVAEHPGSMTPTV